MDKAGRLKTFVQEAEAGGLEMVATETRPAGQSGRA